jgi:hypothetical protein
MTEYDRLTRRHFLSGVTAAGAALACPTMVSPPLFGAADTATSSRPEIAAIYCPLWHRYDHMDAWHGYGWCEWELLKTAPPRFPVQDLRGRQAQTGHSRGVQAS